MFFFYVSDGGKSRTSSLLDDHKPIMSILITLGGFLKPSKGWGEETLLHKGA
jgi:hypothetical protein